MKYLFFFGLVLLFGRFFPDPSTFGGTIAFILLCLLMPDGHKKCEKECCKGTPEYQEWIKKYPPRPSPAASVGSAPGHQ